jgi:hypothetical protein
LGAGALLEEDVIYEKAAASYRDFLSQRAIIKSLLTTNTQKRMILRDLFPAINVLNEVDRFEINGVEPPGIERVAEMIFEGFERARQFQDKTREELLNDNIPVYKLDILVDSVKDHLRSEGRWEEPYSTYIDDWLAGQETRELVMNIAGTAIEIGLAVAAVFTGGLSAVLLGLAGGALGLGMAAYNFEIAEDVMDAAAAGRGGTYQFADIEEARINMFFAAIDLFLSAIDFVLAASNALELVENVHIKKRDLDLDEVDDVSGDVSYMKGKAVAPSPRTYDDALNPEAYAYKIANKYNINLKGSGKNIKIIFDDSLPLGQYGVTKQIEGGLVIRLGPSAYANETTLANTIAHELNHCRAYLKGIPAIEPPAYSAGNSLEAFILGER